HGQTCTVHQAADVAVQLDVGQVVLAGFNFSRIFFSQVTESHDIGVTEQSVAVEVELGVQSDDVARAGQDQRVDLGQFSVGFGVALVQLLEFSNGVFDRSVRHADTASQLGGLLVGQANSRVHEFFQNGVGVALGHFFNFHAAFAGSHHGHALGSTVGNDTDVVFLLDVRAFLDQQATHFLAFRASLVSDQLHAQDFRGQLTHFVHRASQLDATALATATGVNLGFDNPHRATQLLRSCNRFIDGEGRNSAWHGNAKLLKQCFALIFVNFHVIPVSLKTQ